MPTPRHHINGWLIIDKPYSLGSTTVVARLKKALSPTKIGHAGTLDPLATGILPIALGQATRLIPYVMDGQKTYEFQITWGAETTTDDSEGTITQTTAARPTEAEIKAALPAFIGTVNQLPPAYSALKINGHRAYDLARSGREVSLAPRPVRIDTLELLRTTTDTADFRVSCGKGTYVRALGRDIGRRLGCLGYITHLRRTACGPFTLADAVQLDTLTTPPLPDPIPLLPLEKAINHMPTLTVPPAEAHRLNQGQRLALKPLSAGLSRPVSEYEVACLLCAGHVLGLVKIAHNTIHPYRIFADNISS